MPKENDPNEIHKPKETPEPFPVIPEEPELPIEEQEIIAKENPSEIPPVEIPQPNKDN